jgi:hypothetical protein
MPRRRVRSRGAQRPHARAQFFPGRIPQASRPPPPRSATCRGRPHAGLSELAGGHVLSGLPICLRWARSPSWTLGTRPCARSGRRPGLATFQRGTLAAKFQLRILLRFFPPRRRTSWGIRWGKLFRVRTVSRKTAGYEATLGGGLLRDRPSRGVEEGSTEAAGVPLVSSAPSQVRAMTTRAIVGSGEHAR